MSRYWVVAATAYGAGLLCLLDGGSTLGPYWFASLALSIVTGILVAQFGDRSEGKP